MYNFCRKMIPDYIQNVKGTVTNVASYCCPTYYHIYSYHVFIIYKIFVGNNGPRTRSNEGAVTLVRG